ncbi:MAG: 16S rRNA (adenine(1518)-N(6)/adenine(1519)-N(6))-dimethyltransferase RsmA [Ignavibacteriae bacterium]|nr:16S rRNA (adenine(1518)-N(6)/adenine(1519)-N(6))-dimethyltransferase RsmA [Ignavibacteriota bacterium]NOG99462.1 16S rRNA (adenine(1518)-N(6)/adenine(1519)-N(6))-dimethyltransferase RsmA [Ignavibacteriota bacterium]
MKKSIKALKRYGQNFLVDENIITKIVDTFSPAESDYIVEIGPGQGAITAHLFDRTKHFRAIEIDKRAIEILGEKFSGIKIIEKDVLKVDLSRTFDNSKNKIRVIGNIPYNITTSLIQNLIDVRTRIDDAYFMLQLEAAQRLNAKPGEKDYNALTILVQCFTEYKLLFKVSPNSFLPKPNVNSAFVKFKFNKNIDSALDDKILIKLVKTLFISRRKTLKNSLQNSIFNNVDFSQLDIDLSLRPEKLSVPEFIKMSKYIQARSNDKANSK